MATEVEYEDLRLERLHRRLSQFEISLITRIHPRKISAFENGRGGLTPEQTDRLRSALRREAPA